MASFAWSSRFREGQWRAFRKFFLEERRDISSRFAVIDAERARIGEILLLWVPDAEGNPTEKRAGFSVMSKDSSLSKLVQAYVALGGNPLDISMFVGPDRNTQNDAGETQRGVPNGGVLSPLDIRYGYDQGVFDGDTNFLKYRGSRSGGKGYNTREPQIAGMIQLARRPISKEIWWKRTRIEELIIKLCDLREQLDNEVSDLIWASFGDGAGNVPYDPERYAPYGALASIARHFDGIFRVPDPDNKGIVRVDNNADAGKPGALNQENLGNYPSLLTDLDEEENTAM